MLASLAYRWRVYASSRTSLNSRRRAAERSLPALERRSPLSRICIANPERSYHDAVAGSLLL
jgi:hypothetical protein